MARRAYLFDTPDRFIAGTVGEPGSRTFFLQAREGGRIASVALEKIQVVALAQRLGELLDELRSRGIDVPSELPVGSRDVGPLDEPLIEAFRVGTLTIGWDPQRGDVVLQALAIVPEDEDEDEDEDGVDLDDDTEEDDDGELELAEDDPDGPDFVRVRLSPGATATFVERAARVVAAGRLPCPVCGQPLDPQGHMCPRKNGYLN
jgi:uncharacterized repeat protein (TIGR03847 family)